MHQILALQQYHKLYSDHPISCQLSSFNLSNIGSSSSNSPCIRSVHDLTSIIGYRLCYNLDIRSRTNLLPNFVTPIKELLKIPIISAVICFAESLRNTEKIPANGTVKFAD